jgi:UDP-GlcNAc:undecaprenyl-phosphate GlcNAc-1-phosphate transferase
MTPYLLMAASALVLTLSGTPVMRLVALRFGVIDQPAARKIHHNPVPLLGGAAIYLAFCIVLFLFGDRRYIHEVIGIFIGASLMSLMGVVDDRWGLGSYIKLGGQLLAAAILIYSGVQVRVWGGWLDIGVTVLWVVGITNAMNLLDNMDGHPVSVAQRPIPGRCVGRGAGRRLCRVSRLQLEPGQYFHGRYRQPLPWLFVGGRRYQVAFPHE